MTASRLATTLDQEMLAAHGVAIAPPSTPDGQLPCRPGFEVASELGDRLLLRYLLPSQLGQFSTGSQARKHWVTPTPYAPANANTWLALWQPQLLRQYVMLLDPNPIDLICGPRWIRFGHGIEYVLPQGFPQAALMPVPEIGVT